MISEFKKYLLKTAKATDCFEKHVIQSLWSGYGKISRYQLSESPHDTVIVKHIALEKLIDHPRGWNSDISHNRKIKSYQVETYWYEKWSHHCTEECRVPKFIGSFAEGVNRWIIMEDLDKDFPLQKDQVSLSEIKQCLKWLANFHISFLFMNANGLWDIGTYWHLNTRPDEFKKINNQELKSNAHAIDSLLNDCKYQTIVHGDAKLANFCFSGNSNGVAAVDFQYVGGGCGIKDVSYFLSSCLAAEESEKHEQELLNYYFTELRIAYDSSELNFEYSELEREWREMYPIACADFARFLLGWMPSHRKLNRYTMNKVEVVLKMLSEDFKR